MRLEYVVIGFILMVVIIAVAVSMLTGVLPSIDSIFGYAHKAAG